MGDDAGTPPGEPNQGGFAGMDSYGNGGDTGQNYTQPGGTEFQASPDQEYTGPET